MRVYTNVWLSNLWAYGKLLLAIAVLWVVVSQAAKIWSDEPAVQQLQQLMERVEKP